MNHVRLIRQVLVVSLLLAALAAVPAAAHHRPGHTGGPTTTTTTSSTTSTTSSSTTTTTTPPGGATVPSSIPADCSTDTTAALNAWIASVPDGSLLSFTGGCYRIDGALRVPDRNNLTFDGNGATFRATVPADGDRKQWWILGGSNIALTDMTIEGDNLTVADGAYTTKETQHLVDFWGTQGATVDGVTGRWAWGDFVAFNADYRLPLEQIQPVRSAAVRNSTFIGAGRMGVSANYIDGLTVENNSLDQVRWSTIDIEVESSTWYARNIAITGNTIGDVWHSFIANSGFNAPTDNVTVTGNTMTRVPGTNQPAIHIDGTPDGLRSHWLIEGNTLITRGYLLHLDHAADITFRNNLGWSRNYDSIAVRIQESDSGTVTGNDLSGLWPDTGGYFTAVHEIDSLSPGWTVCGNQLPTGPNQPVPC